MILAGIAVAVLAARFKPPTLIGGGMAGVAFAIAAMAGVRTIWHMSAVLFVVGLLVTPGPGIYRHPHSNIDR